MKRREAILNVAMMMGGILSTPSMAAITEGLKPHRIKPVGSAFELNDAHFNLLEEITETIIPTTSTPGAKAAKVAETIVLLLKDCYKPEQQNHFKAGLEALENESVKAYSLSFVKLENKQKTEILKKFEEMAKAEKKQAQTKPKSVDAETSIQQIENRRSASLIPFFTLAKELTILGYFSSEIGCTQALEYVAVPGRYDAVTTLKSGQKAWAVN